MTYLIMWAVMSAVLSAVGFGIGWYEGIELPPLLIIMGSMAFSAFCVANDLKRPQPKEYNRQAALYPPIPKKYLQKEPISESVIFGKDYHTGYFVQAEKGHHCMVIGSTGSGKTATSLIGAILSCTSGSKQIVVGTAHIGHLRQAIE